MPAGSRAAETFPPARKSFHLRGEAKRLPVIGVVERLDPVRVAGQKQRPRPRVPDGEGKHAAHPWQHRLAPLRVHAENDFGVRRRIERLAVALELGAQLGEVVDLAVERQHHPAVAAEHRLVGAIADVDDGETTVTEAGAAIGGEPGPGGVGAARPHGLTGARQLIEIDRRRAGAKGDDAIDAAHGSGTNDHTSRLNSS